MFFSSLVFSYPSLIFSFWKILRFTSQPAWRLFCDHLNILISFCVWTLNVVSTRSSPFRFAPVHHSVSTDSETRSSNPPFSPLLLSPNAHRLSALSVYMASGNLFANILASYEQKMPTSSTFCWISAKFDRFFAYFSILFFWIMQN